VSSLFCSSLSASALSSEMIDLIVLVMLVKPRVAELLLSIQRLHSELFVGVLEAHILRALHIPEDFLACLNAPLGLFCMFKANFCRTTLCVFHVYVSLLFQQQC
jgi:hypothetical protein